MLWRIWLKVTNAGKEAFDFTGSFHTYLAADIESVAVGGLEAGAEVEPLNVVACYH